MDIKNITIILFAEKYCDNEHIARVISFLTKNILFKTTKANKGVHL